VVDAATGAARAFDRGSFAFLLTPAPQGGRLAYLRKLGALDMSGVKTKAILGVGDRSQLMIYDSAKGKISVPLCEGCSVDDGSLRWSPSGAQLYYSVRSRQQDELAHRHYLYDVAAGTAIALRTPGLVWDTEEEQARYLAPLLWLDEQHLAVRTRRKDAGQFEDQDYRWTRIDRSGAVQGELTAAIPRGDDKQVFKYPVAVYQGGLLFIADRQLWHAPAQGAPRSLTAALGADVESWCAPYAPWRMATPRCDALGSDSIFPTADALALERHQLALRIMREGVFTGEFAFIDLASGAVKRVQRPTEDSMPLEASALAGAALFQRKGSDGDEVLLVRAGQAPVSVHRFNAHLANVGAATPVLLTRREAGEDEDRNDWLLLPPNHQPGQRHPLLVYFYPDTRYRKELKGDDLRDISFLNKNIPAAHGYAVLLASMKISDYGTAGGNPMREMHEQLIRAAENAVAQGYVDPDRWAIMGHSYGGYGTNSIITQTGRFKAAVSLAGLANLSSGYGIGMNTDKTFAVPEGLNFGALWSEGGQGRMGVPPWKDPQRYIDNSPLFQADKITTPLMLIHGDLDFVNVNEAEQLFAALHRQGKDVQLVRYWGEGHTYLSPGNIEDMWARIFAFLDESGLRGPAQGQASASARAAP
jgi:dipeptidyl aminopeptidase/acylaminoacyl peptidase